MITSMRSRAFRRHQTESHFNRRLKEDRNQHYDDQTSPCYTDPRMIARFKEQPKLCSCYMCGNPRRIAKAGRLTIQELRAPTE